MLKKLSLTAAAGALAAALAAPLAANATFLTPAPCDFVTGGGFAFKDNGEMVNYGIHAGCKHDQFWGHINYVDHETGFHLRSVQITGYLRETLADGTVLVNTRDFCGWATINDEPALRMFRVTVTDNGEPGTGDLVGISIDGVHESFGTRFYMVTERNVSGGNIQLHKGNRSNTAPEELMTQTQQCGDLTGLNAP
jgi:hypothetical protein